MKILHIISGLETGGAEMYLYRLLPYLEEQGFRNSVMSVSSDGSVGEMIKKLGLPVVALQLNHFTGLSNLARLSKMVEEPDCIQGWMYHGNFVALLARKSWKKKSLPLLWNIRCSLENFQNDKLTTKWTVRSNSFLSKFPKNIIYNSEVARKDHENFGFCKQNGIVIHNGVSTSQFSKQEGRDQMRSQLEIPEDALLGINVGRYHEDKGQELFIPFLAQWMEKRPNVYFAFVGRNMDSKNIDLMKLIPSSLRNRLFLLGEQSNIPLWLNGSDFYVACSKRESFPNNLVEAMSCELPCVTTKVGDSESLLKGIGPIVEPSQPKALIEAVNLVCSYPRQIRQKMGDLGRKRVESHYTIEKSASKYIQLYSSLRSP